MEPKAIAYATLAAASALAGTARAADDPVTFRGSLAWLNAYRHTAPTETVLNPENQNFEIARHTLSSELKPNLKLTAKNLSFIVRPLIRVEASDVEVNEERQTDHGKSGDEVAEAYGQWMVSPSVTFAYGRQNYQWGAAESLSPSNRLFHETAQAKNVLYDVRGRDMARLNLSAGKSFSTVIMTELKENPDQPKFAAEDEFQTAGLIKPEISWNSGASYFGLVAGARERDRGWVGEYCNWALPIPDGLSIYADASHERGSRAWYPVEAPSVGPTGSTTTVTFDKSQRDGKDLRTLAVGGLRYDFVGGTVARAEYIYNQAAWDKDERAVALKAFDVTNPTQIPVFEQNALRYLSPGLEIPGQRFAFASLMTPDVLGFKDFTLYIRGTRSLTDSTNEGYSSLEVKVGDSGTLLLAAAGTSGVKDGELRGFAAPTQILAYRNDW